MLCLISSHVDLMIIDFTFALWIVALLSSLNQPVELSLSAPPNTMLIVFPSRPPFWYLSLEAALWSSSFSRKLECVLERSQCAAVTAGRVAVQVMESVFQSCCHVNGKRRTLRAI